MTAIAVGLLAAPILAAGYAYLGYPAALWLVNAVRRRRGLPGGDPEEWPEISICLPVYNEEEVIEETLQSLLDLDYPPSRRQLLVVSDASTDRTDEIVSSFAERGVQLLRLETRAGKTAAENASLEHVRGEIIVNTDATTRIPRRSLKRLVRAFQDPGVGVASGRDVSTALASADQNRAEAPYVDYEMWIRELETRVDSIVGASGCFYAIRYGLHARIVPPALSRDFSAALAAKEAGFRAVSISDAICYVPRTTALKAEFRRKARTMARGLATLWHYRQLMGVRRYGWFAWMLFSHKLARWLVPLLAPLLVLGLVLLSTSHGWALAALALCLLAGAAAAVAWFWPPERTLPGPISVPGYLVGSLGAGFIAWMRFARGEKDAYWEPTRRTFSRETQAEVDESA